MGIIDYNKIERRWVEYVAANSKNLRSLSSDDDAITQANTDGCQCRLTNGDFVYNFVEDCFVAGGLAGMLPPGADWKAIVDEVFLGGKSLATLIGQATDNEWSQVIHNH
jgi:hypothetical protein